MKTSEIIVIGAGISGLAVTRELCNAGIHVTVLEARNRVGGRIHTIDESEFPASAETGAEFIHGRLPQTIKLLRYYGIKFSKTEGEVLELQNGTFEKNYSIISEHRKLLQHKLKNLSEDISVQQFLELNFQGEEFSLLREEVKRFVEGFDTADITRASTFEFREEWSEVKDWKQYRVEGGYTRLTEALTQDCKSKGASFHLSSTVKKIRWKQNQVEIVCNDDKKFFAEQVVITVPLGVLQSGSIKFHPELSEKKSALAQLGFGKVIKILLYFKDEFWKNKEVQQRTGRKFDKLFFLYADTPIPTWWTQYPSKKPLLTGWLSGPQVKKYENLPNEKILQKAIASLASIFKEDELKLESDLLSSKIINWSKDTFTRGSYAYATVDAKKQIEIAGSPVENTLFFAGEVFAPEAGTGLVESAIVSGQKTAKQILDRNKIAESTKYLFAG